MAAELPLGTRIKRARERLRWSQQQLADALKVSVKTVDNWENLRTNPRSSLGAIEHLFAQHGIDLYDGTPGLPPEVTDNPDDEVIAEVWSKTALTPEERLGIIRIYLRTRPPRRRQSRPEDGSALAPAPA